MSIRIHILPLLAASLALAIALAGCQKTQEALADSAIERASGGQLQVQRAGDAVTLRGERGELAMRSGDALPLPEDFPADIYLPADYRINSVMDMDGMRVISLQAPGKVNGLFGAAREAMGRQGWKQTMAMQNAADTAMLSFEKDKRAAVLSFNGGRGDDVTMSVQVRSARM